MTAILLVLALMLALLPNGQPAAAQSVSFDEIQGNLPDDTFFRIRVPENWHGTLINDLDYAGRANSAFQMYMLEQGYALSGTQRHPLRQFQYDPLQEADNQVRVLDIFEDEFGVPDRVIQYGQSGGGLIAQGMAEVHGDRVDAVVSACTQNPLPLHNLRLDAFFTLRTLTAPGQGDDELPIVDLPPPGAELFAIEDAWTDVLVSAQDTPEGRARIALAITIGQWPTWSNRSMPEPDPRDIEAVQEAMFHSVLITITQNFRTRNRNENAGGGVSNWNTGVDYEKFFNNGDPAQKRVVRELYRQAGLNLKEDLARLNDAPRIAADTDVVDDFWRVPPRTIDGTPEVPIFQFGEIGDFQTPQAQMGAYESRVRSLGLGPLYRQAVVRGAGHCAFTVSERVVAVETVMDRLDTGRWAPTHPKALNARAEALGLDESRFIRHNWPKLNRAFFPETEIDS